MTNELSECDETEVPLERELITQRGWRIVRGQNVKTTVSRGVCNLRLQIATSSLRAGVWEMAMGSEKTLEVR